MNIAIIGGGPAGLRAAEVAAEGGAKVFLFEAKPSVGRKFLVAGRGGLNLTKAEPREQFVSRYTGSGGSGGSTEAAWPSLIAGFDSVALRAWAEGLGIETFVASTGRVYPRELKAAPLLRRWVERLRALGVTLTMNRRWTGIVPPSKAGAPLQLEFADTGNGGTGGGKPSFFSADAAILAMGGGSWPQTGSNGLWTAPLERLGIGIAPLKAANCGWEVEWPPGILAQAEGKPLKNLVARAGTGGQGQGHAQNQAHTWKAAGELMITRYGLEGGALYQLGPALRALPNPELCLDFKPGVTLETLVTRLGPARKNFLAEARVRWRLSEAVFALLQSREPFLSAGALAAETKHFRLPLIGPRPLSEAISSAGGIRWEELTGNLMLRRLPGVFVAGEMIDWEAPTGGYLLQGCFATGTRAAQGALKFCASDGRVAMTSTPPDTP